VELIGQMYDTIKLEKIALSSVISIADITHINHDLQGNLWITTLDGFYKYDGYDMVKNIANENLSYGLIKNSTYRSHVSSDGSLWMAGAYSIYKYDHFKDQIIRMTEKARRKNKKLYKIGYFDIEDIDNNHLVFGTKAGLAIYDKEEKEIIDFDSLVLDYKVDSYSTNAHVFLIEKDPEFPQILWLLTKSGIYSFDCLTRKSELVFYDESVNFENLGERGFSMIVQGDFIYYLINYKRLFKYERSTDRNTEIKQYFDRNTPSHIRNILPSKDGFLISYIRQGIHEYSNSQNRIKKIASLYEDGSECKGISYVGTDHEDRYTMVVENNLLVKSKLGVAPKQLQKEIWTKNLTIEGDLVYDTIKNRYRHDLENYERNVTFEIGLTNRNNTFKELYYYRTDKNEEWIRLDNNVVKLSHLAPGEHTIFCKIWANDIEYTGVVKTFFISPYFYETIEFALILLLGLLALAGIIYYLINIRKKDKKVYQRKMLELEMNALRSQMNPHFLFNSINSIKSYVVSKNKEETAEYLTQFAKLIRMILENSRKKYLSIESEIEMLKLYIIMEQKRLNYSFDFNFEIDNEIDTNFLIVPMLIQPYIENAIWHGLMNKYGDKLLSIDFKVHESGVQVIVIDNGVGRAKSKSFNTKNPTSKKSLGLRITEDRVELIKKIYKIDASVKVIDLHNEQGIPSGTEVQIVLPYINEFLQYD
jgi:hypothetical protein